MLYLELINYYGSFHQVKCLEYLTCIPVTLKSQGKKLYFYNDFKGISSRDNFLYCLPKVMIQVNYVGPFQSRIFYSID